MLNQIDLSRFDLNLLVLFEAVFDERHVGRTADRLSLSPSAVSHGLGRLRILLGDPLFLKTPKGVVPTARAEALAGPVADILSRVRGVVATREPFDPARSSRSFTIGAPDGVSAVFLPPLLAVLAREAPGIDVRIRQLLPRPGTTGPGPHAWSDTIADLESRALDLAIVPAGGFPARFAERLFYREDFVIASRAGHPLLVRPTLEDYRAARHLVVSHGGDPHGFVDTLLAARGLSRHVALTVPNFLFALSVLADSDLVSALPRRFVAAHGARFGVVGVDPPLPLGDFALTIVVPDVALRDAGIAWLVDALEKVGRPLGG